MASDREARTALPGVSVVIPSYDRAPLLIQTLERCLACAGPVDLELVVVDDGSRDDTASRLESFAREHPGLVWRSVPNGGPGRARNVGAALAKHDVVLFLGDDIQPADAHFFLTHAELHARHPERGFAMLGRVTWPNRPDAEVNFVMAHIQGPGGEQFGYADFQPYSELDWRFFYTANVSVKRNVVDDWHAEGFSSAFTRYGYEDGEFAYRMMKRAVAPMRLFYVPAASASHHHPISADAFLERQVSAGMMARVFLDLHRDPELPAMLGVAETCRALEQPALPDEGVLVSDLLAMIEGVKAWVRMVERMQRMGSQWWHDELLRASFALCYQQGFVLACSRPDANIAAACWLMLDAFGRAMQRAVHVELLGTAAGGRRELAGLFQLDLPAAGPAAGGRLRRAARRLLIEAPHRAPRLRDWAKRHPRIAAAFRRLRHRIAGIA